ncbi:MAG TPA: nucleotidyltransferase [Archangium sp.]|nr:nucleotidyltransferase [Archangium sp.]
MRRALDAEFVTAYAQGPSESVVQQAIAAHQGVRQALGDLDYLTFLQGSYRNDTALADMNDVDIVAVSRRAGLTTREALFRDIKNRLQQSSQYVGRWTEEDKCIRLNLPVRIDIVPAIASDPYQDPIEIFSLRGGQRQNWPRLHHEKGKAKSAATSGHFKQVVRLFKRWRTCHFGSRKVAPSYYLECLLYTFPNTSFSADLATNFVTLSQAILRAFPDARAYHSRPLPRMAGQGNLFSSGEWDAQSFEQFRGRLAQALPHAERALGAATPERARQDWKAAFNGQQ